MVWARKSKQKMKELTEWKEQMLAKGGWRLVKAPLDTVSMLATHCKTTPAIFSVSAHPLSTFANSVLREEILFQHLEERDMDLVVDAMQLKTFDDGEIVIQQ